MTSTKVNTIINELSPNPIVREFMRKRHASMRGRIDSTKYQNKLKVYAIQDLVAVGLVGVKTF